MSDSLPALLYLVASVCFIMALRGLSSPETARWGNIYGVAGMAIAIVTTLVTPQIVSYWLIGIGLLIGGAIGTYIARQIQMTALPQLVAAFHSLVGLAAVCVATAAFAAPEAYGIGIRGAIHGASLVEMAIGLVIGAITFTGSLDAFAKLKDRVCQILFARSRHEVGSRVAGGSVHPHVERFVALEAEPATWLVELHRGNAKVGEGTVHERHPEAVEYVVERAVVCVNQRHALIPRRQCAAREGQGVAIAIQADNPGRAGCQERARVSPESHGTIDEDAPALGPQVLQCFGGQDRNVRAQMPNPESACASASEKGSRSIFVRNRS